MTSIQASCEVGGLHHDSYDFPHPTSIVLLRFAKSKMVSCEDVFVLCLGCSPIYTEQH